MPGLTLFLDPFSGIAGDMLIGALLDLGLDLALLHHELGKLNLRGYNLSSKRVMRGVMAGVKFDVEIEGVLQKEFDHPGTPEAVDPNAAPGGFHDHEHAHDHGHEHGHGHGHEHGHSHGSPSPANSGSDARQRSFSEIKTLIEDSTLSARVKADSIRVFTRLAEAEALIHGMAIETVHFHEVGALDSIIDIVGACIGIEALGVGDVWCAPVALGSGGYVQCDHGLLPAPAPATLAIMKGIPTRPSPVQMELTTPTGAALAAGLSANFGPLPAMRIQKIGYGAGSRENQAVPNLLRAILGTQEQPAVKESGENSSDTILEVRANIDDSTPEVLGHVCDMLLAAGALDVFLQPLQMKKFRPGTLLSVLIEPHLLDKAAEILFRESSTFGLRYSQQSRLKLSRRVETVQTPFGPLRVKIGSWQGSVVSRHPEYEDCRQAAAAHKTPLQAVIAAAKDAAASIEI